MFFLVSFIDTAKSMFYRKAFMKKKEAIPGMVGGCKKKC